MLKQALQYFSYNYSLTPEQIGIVHVGVGAFHRSHQAVYLDDLLGKYDQRWGIIGINLREQDSLLVDKINARNGRYFLKSISSAGDTGWRQICSIRRVIDATKYPEDAFRILINTNIKLLTMTVTESGYYTNDWHQLDLTHPLIKEEIDTDKPKGSIFGYLREALTRRMQAGNAPITIICCDNLNHNGALLKSCLYTYLQASKRDDLCHWLDQYVSFPCSVVDRITPNATPELYEETRRLFFVDNDASVIAEDFTQWIIEDHFTNEKPALNQVGVKFVDDVTPYEDTKIRILNGGHSCLAYLGALKKYTYFHEAMLDSKLLNIFEQYQLDEVIPALKHDFEQNNYQEDPDCNLNEYYHIIKNRFTNRSIGDTIARITTDGASKFPLFILPTTLCSLKRGKNAVVSAIIIASWYVFLDQYYQQKIPFIYQDHKWDHLVKNVMKDGKLNIENFLNDHNIWHNIPQDYPEFLLLVKQQIETVKEMVEI